MVEKRFKHLFRFLVFTVGDCTFAFQEEIEIVRFWKACQEAVVKLDIFLYVCRIYRAFLGDIAHHIGIKASARLPHFYLLFLVKRKPLD